jgi:GMP synthase-like glutamine amidotransferase
MSTNDKLITKISIHTFMHVPYEGLGCIKDWITDKGHSLTYTRFYEHYKLPNLNDIDWLIVMGGPMGVYDEKIYPWLTKEKEFINQAIINGKTIIGICLGSQLIAEVLGAKVFPNKQKEIGWFDILQSDTLSNHPFCDFFEAQFKAFHWHGDTFELPNGSIHLFQSEFCLNQAFLFNNKILGLQFHFEVTLLSIRSMLLNGSSELVESVSVQTENEILKQSGFITANNLKMFKLLDYLAK